jgi:hypothetical protein
VPFRPPLLDVSSERSFALIRGWISDCNENHTMCPSTAAAPLPTRVLAVSQAGEGLVRLHTSTANDDGSYAALSYCWGGPQPDQTVKSNVETYAKGIQTKHLPKTIQDAILVTWKLGIPYLWIDPRRPEGQGNRNHNDASHL